MGGFVRKIIRAPSKIIKKVIKPPTPPAPTAPTQAKKVVQKTAVKTAPKGPTKAEMIATKEEDAKKILVANKRKGRKAQQLTGATGLEEETYLSKKSMLG
tara:strand:+ start:260 stop:559 length:300 start_codon:yes stop_codon:yes gene_type:complete